jgi:glucose uptake protein
VNLGYIFAFLTILLFGSWAVPTKTLKINPIAQAFWLTVGHFLLSSIIFLFVFQTIPLKQFLPPFLAGIIWGVGIFSGYVAIRHLGITRALGIWVPVVIIVSTLWGLLFFGEAAKLGSGKLILTLLGISLLIVATLAVISTLKGEKKITMVKVGILAALILGIFHGSYFVPLRASNLSIFVTFLPLTIGMVITTAILAKIQHVKFIYDKFSTLRMILAGLLLGGGNYLALLTVQSIGVAQGYPLTQLGIIVNTLWGVFVFKEITGIKSKIIIAVGILLAIIGAVVLNQARLR